LPSIIELSSQYQPRFFVFGFLGFSLLYVALADKQDQNGQDYGDGYDLNFHLVFSRLSQFCLFHPKARLRQALELVKKLLIKRITGSFIPVDGNFSPSF